MTLPAGQLQRRVAYTICHVSVHSSSTLALAEDASSCASPILVHVKFRSWAQQLDDYGQMAIPAGPAVIRFDLIIGVYCINTIKNS
jgi:hypothetical protein